MYCDKFIDIEMS